VRINRILPLLLIVFVTSRVHADIDSGPKVGTVVSPLKVFAATGDHAGKELDIAAERSKKPTIYIFLQHERFDRPLARLIKVMEKGAIEAGNDSGLVTVFLTGDEAKTKEHLPRIQTSLQFTANPLVIYPSATMSPEGWSVNTDAQLTALVVNEGKVTASFGYRSANETVAPEILTALKKAVGK
jgi:hypothetical protein